MFKSLFFLAALSGHRVVAPSSVKLFNKLEIYFASAKDLDNVSGQLNKLFDDFEFDLSHDNEDLEDGYNIILKFEKPKPKDSINKVLDQIPNSDFKEVSDLNDKYAVEFSFK